MGIELPVPFVLCSLLALTRCVAYETPPPTTTRTKQSGADVGWFWQLTLARYHRPPPSHPTGGRQCTNTPASTAKSITRA